MAQFTELIGKTTDVLTVRRVFGEPVERDGVTVIPVARVRGAWGGGSGGPPAAEGTEPQETGVGGGGAHSAGPAGVYVIRDGEVSWLPADDPGRTVLVGCATAIVALLVIRSIAGRALARRDR